MVCCNVVPEQTMNWNENRVSIVLQIGQFQPYMVLLWTGR